MTYRTSSSFFIFIVSVTFAVVLSSVIFPNLLSKLSIWILLASVFMIGIPHGAIDHIVASEIYGGENTLQFNLKFYSSYLFIMALLGVIWVLTPVLGMLIFLGISVYHFGQADMKDFLVHDKNETLWFLVRGTAVILLIIFSDIEQTIPIIADAVRMDHSVLMNYIPRPVTVFLPLSVVYAAFSLYSFIKGNLNPGTSYFTDAICLILIFYLSGPLIGFAIYFALWHSAGHIHEMLEFFKKRGDRKINVPVFIIKSVPFTLISVTGLYLLYLFQEIYFSTHEFVTIMFILISVLTLPHTVIVNKMYSLK